MDVQEFFEYAGWALMAVIKFVITPSMMIGLGYSPWMTWLTTAAGAMIGVLVFWHFGRLLFRWYDDRMQSLGRESRIFTPRKRRMLRWKKSLGWTGLLFVSGLISVPIASVLGAKYFDKRPRAIWGLMLAFLVWAGSLTLISFGIGNWMR